jgi:hypothetical protein
MSKKPIQAVPETTDLKKQRATVNAAAARVDTLHAHRARLLDAIQDDGADEGLRIEHEDLLAARALGEDVAARLAEVEAQLSQAAAAAAVKRGETAATLAGLARKIEAAEADLADAQRMLKALTDDQLDVEINTAVQQYEQISESLALALGELHALALIREAPTLGTPAGLLFGDLGRVFLPRVRGDGAPLLSPEQHWEASDKRTAAIRARLGI